MSERRRSSALVSYINTIFVLDLVLFVIAFVFSGFAVNGLAAPLAFVGAAALLFGVFYGSGYVPGDLLGLLADTEAPIIRAMKGRNPGHPLADYASSVEYRQMEPHLVDDRQQENVDALQSDRLRARKNAKLAKCIVIAGLLALASSYVLNRLFVR